MTGPVRTPITGPQPRAAVLNIAAYVGGDSKLVGADRSIKLSSNEAPFGPPPDAQYAFLQLATEQHRYPDGGSVELRHAIGRRFNLDASRIICGTGSDELIQHLALIYGGPGTDILMTMHGFAMYQIGGTYAGSRVIKVPERNLTTDVDALVAAVTPATRIVFLANPNNPTGSLLAQTEIERLRVGLPDTVLLVLDAAYAEYVERDDYDPGVALVDAAQDTVMLRTFSKIFGLGGMRVGWCYAPAPVADALNRVRGAFNINLAAQAMAVAALSESGWVERSRAHNAQWREYLATALRACGITVWPSECNFVLADLVTPERARAADAALRVGGVIVRGLASYDLPHCLRITVGTGEECTLVADLLARFMAEQTAAAQIAHV